MLNAKRVIKLTLIAFVLLMAYEIVAWVSIIHQTLRP